jgi:hypothetical protein
MSDTSVRVTVDGSLRLTRASKVCAALVGLGLLIVGIEGCSGGGGGSGGGLPTGNLTVTARVIAPTGQPVPDVAIWISGHGPFRTDANGEVTVQGMPSPYEALIVDGAEATAHFWPALTRPDPTFTVTRSLNSSTGASIDGTVTGGIGFPVPPTHQTDVYVALHDALGGSSNQADPTTGAYTFSNLIWSGAIETEATLYGLQYLKDANGDPVSFTGFGSLAVPVLSASSSLTAQDIALAPVPTTTITGMVSLAPGLTSLTEALILQPAAGGFFTASTSGSNPLPSFSLAAPVVPGLARNLLAVAGDYQQLSFIYVMAANLPDPATNLVVSVPHPTGHVLPIDGVTDVGHDTLFQVTPSAGRVFDVTFSPVSGIGPTIHVHTAEPTLTIPDLSSFGVVIPPGAEYQWSVVAQGPLASLDEAATVPNFLIFASFVSNGSGDAFVCGTSDDWKFTFGP